MTRRVVVVALMAMVGLAACGSGAQLTGRVRSAADISRCLRAAHLAVEETRLADTGVTKARGLRTLVYISDSDAVVELIGVFRDRADAARSFRAAVDAAELLDGNTILGITGYPPPSAGLTGRIERCAFGPDSSPTPSRSYGEAYRRPGSGHAVVLRSGCLGCHQIGAAGNHGPGENLTNIGRQLTASQIAEVLRDPAAPMPSFGELERTDPRAWHGLISYLSQLGR